MRCRRITTSAAVQAKTQFMAEDPDLIYEFPTASSSTDPPRPERMVNTAVSVDRGVVIRAGSGAGPPVSSADPTRNPGP